MEAAERASEAAEAAATKLAMAHEELDRAVRGRER